MDENHSRIFDMIMDISWFFGSQGFEGDCCRDLSLIEYMTLKKISLLNTTSVQLLGKELNVTKSGMSKVITKLEKKGYIKKEKDQADGRVCCLIVTPQGRNVLKDIAASYSDYIGRALNDVGESEKEEAIKSLEIFYNAFHKTGYKKKVN
ncbi:MarR family winged helix-turn-helix transcriptional regulator [Fervidibacillus albus]|uniref:MarR family winged helix-turn-helix transcriptional regulator n=1 Tax=Fervidibacillus albus TaxID=2980026 RepID=A0A9E8LTH8_9BACI|nr:MarR family winged helix-turn-helix transcriptional regulator [Fervidibacillus albus]WAA08906.1 MarR family winged helix-turn-helix transcriptional regulator [Fervidibacillus albus]